ncbi:beta-ketoacyl-ACP synthase III [Aquabacterium sp.]|uniref:beta-ketoacyl-ACP synthase III n=1 Tax=Aquabacterium sp. TaxID=1872578 RepID=UPI0039C8AB5F
MTPSPKVAGGDGPGSIRLYARIAGTGSCLPPRRLSNQDLADQLARDGIETSDAWIVERTGIRFRHFADPGMSSSSMGAQAALQALEAAGCAASEVDLIICATSTPDMVFPSTACLIQRQLGIRGGAAFDVQAVCSGFIYALSIADAMIRTGAARKALIIGAEVFSRILDFKDRTTCVLFGDGAGAVLLEVSSAPGIVASCLHADGAYADILKTPGTISGGEVLGDPFLRMEGQAVFKQAIVALGETTEEVLTLAGRDITQVDWLILHQANIRIMQTAARKLGLPMERVLVTVDQHGNTSAASIPLALDHAIRQGLVTRGQSLLLEGMGGGFTWGGALIDY